MKKKYFIILITIVILISIIGMFFLISKNESSNEIPNDYIIIFKGENGQIVNTTYIYEKIEKKKKKIIKTYKYINTTSTYNGYDSSSWTEEVTKKGTLKKKNEIFIIAQENNANSYVKYLPEDQIYTIEDFKNIWK